MPHYLEISKLDAHHSCYELQITQNSTVISNPLIIQNEEWKQEENRCLYSILNPNNSRTTQTGKPYQGTVICMHFLMVRINIIFLFKEMIKHVKPHTYIVMITTNLQQYRQYGKST